MFRRRTAPLILVLVCSVLVIVSSYAGAIDWQQQRGKTINILFCRMPYSEALKSMIPEFEKKTGIRVKYEILSEVEFREKLLLDLSSRSGKYDAFLFDPLYGWQYEAAGWVEPLDKYINDSRLTDTAAYDVDDFIKSLLDAGRWNLRPLTGMGQGHLWALPVNTESYILAYRKDMLDKFGLQVPATYDELYQVAKKLTGKSFDGEKIYGFVTRAARYWSTFLVIYGNYFFSYGGQFFDEGLNVLVDDPKVVKATEDLARLLRDTAPPGVMSFDWYESLQSFTTGKYGMIIEADLFAPFWEDATKSKSAGKIGYAPSPKGPAGIKSLRYIWQIGMNSASKNKEATWLFLQWATSKDVLIQTNINGNMDPVRLSGWRDERVRQLVGRWGVKGGEFLNASQEMSTKYSAFYLPPHPQAIQLMDRMVQTLQEVYAREKSADQALKDAKRDIEDINRRLNIKK